MRLLFLLLTFLGALIVPSPAAAQSLVMCDVGGRNCRAGSLSEAGRLGSSFELRQAVNPSAFDSRLPVAVTVMATADSDVFWNGVRLARNGDPDGTGRSGRYVFTVVVPPDLVRPGPNEAMIRVKRPRDLWRVVEPVNVFSVAPLVDPRLDALSHYLPALLMSGALGAAAFWFGITWLIDRTERGAGLLALAAGGAVAQLVVETARAFVAYPHVWQKPRIALIAVLTASVGLLLVRYVAWRFAPAFRDRITLACAGACVLILLLAPSADQKAWGAFAFCMAAVAAMAARALARDKRSPAFALFAAAGAVAWIVRDDGQFLDRDYYLVLGGVFLTLVVEQANSLRRRTDPVVMDPELSGRPEPTTMRIVTGSHIRLEPVDKVAVLTAADDYTEVRMVDGRTWLHTASLSQAVGDGLDRFLRVHRSHAVNRRLVTGGVSLPGGGFRLTLEGGSTVPVGRTFQRSVRTALGLTASSARRPAD